MADSQSEAEEKYLGKFPPREFLRGRGLLGR